MPRRILVVHRDEQVRAELVQLFQRQGHHARAASHLVQALADVRSTGAPDVILVAPSTPGADRFREALRKDPPLAAVPVLALTATMVDGLRDLSRRNTR